MDVLFVLVVELDGDADAGAGERGVEAAEPLLGGGHRVADLVLLGHVRGDELAVGLAQLLGDLGALGVGEVDERDLGALADEALDGGAAEAGGAARDEADSVLQHGFWKREVRITELVRFRVFRAPIRAVIFVVMS